MMSFKDQVVADNLAVFINSVEFGEIKRIKYPGSSPAVDVMVVESDDVNDQHKDRTREYHHYDEGAYQSRTVLYVREDDLGFVPVEDDIFDYGDPNEEGYPYRVAKVVRAMGILELHIEANRT